MFFSHFHFNQIFSADAVIFLKNCKKNAPKMLKTLPSKADQKYFFFTMALSCPNGPNRRIHIPKCGL